MARVAPRVPESTDVLCEKCGYVLNGLPDGGRCPECGKPIAESAGTNRSPTAWDAAPGGGLVNGFARTVGDVVFHPRMFYRTFATRASLASARSFAQLNWWIAAGLFGVAGATHAMWYWSNYSGARLPPVGLLATWLGFTIGLAVVTYLALDGVTRLAARLTNWEGSYRGYRLPYAVVLRGLYYHSPHYLPVAVVTAATVVGFQLVVLVHPDAAQLAVRYLLVLCLEVVVAAGYLFETYWIGMRNMMYANR